MFSNLSIKWQRTLVFLIMLLSLATMGALVYLLLILGNYTGLMVVSTVTPTIIMSIATWLYLRINWSASGILATSPLMTEWKRKILTYVGIGFFLGVPSVYFIMHGVTQSIFSTVFPLAYILLMSVCTIAVVPAFLKATGAIALVRYVIITVALFVILFKVGVYLDSYFPGNLTTTITKNLFFALGCSNVFLLFLLHSAWHQVFTMEKAVVVVAPLNEVVVVHDIPIPINKI
jgi:hypothetical protein